jgi:putative isomerase
MAEWAERRCPENFNAVTGAALDQPDTDSFYGWGALLPYLAVAEVTDINPWNGWEICHGSGDQQVGPLQTPAGEAILQSAGIWLTVSVGGEQILRASVPGRYRWVEISDGVIRMILPPVPADSAAPWLELPRIRRADVIAARIGGQPIEPEAAEDGTCRFRLPAASEPQVFELLAARQLEQPR